MLSSAGVAGGVHGGPRTEEKFAAHDISPAPRPGAADPKAFAEAQAAGRDLPSLHSPLFAPDREPTLKTGAAALAISVLELLPP